MQSVRGVTACFIVFALFLAIARSDPPTPTPGEPARNPEAEAAKNENKTEPDKPETKELLAIIEISKPAVIQAEANVKPKKRRDYSSSEWWLVYVSGGLAIITLALAIYTGKLWRATRDLVERTEETNKTIQRAYVTMSNFCPGLTISDGVVRINTKVKNFGNTPANITGTSLACKITKRGDMLPQTPEYAITPLQNIPNAFLVKKAFFRTTTDIPIGIGKADTVTNGECDLFLVGYVDYRDQFGNRYRGGYARHYDPKGEEDNLILVTQPGYNYDRPRKNGEGNDWGEDAPS